MFEMSHSALKLVSEVQNISWNVFTHLFVKTEKKKKRFGKSEKKNTNQKHKDSRDFTSLS